MKANQSRASLEATARSNSSHRGCSAVVERSSVWVLVNSLSSRTENKYRFQAGLLQEPSRDRHPLQPLTVCKNASLHLTPSDKFDEEMIAQVHANWAAIKSTSEKHEHFPAGTYAGEAPTGASIRKRSLSPRFTSKCG